MEPLLTFAGGVESPLSTDADADADAEPEMLKARDLFLALLFPFDLIALSFASFFTPPVPDPVPGPILASAPAALDFVPRMATAAVFPVSILFMPLVRVQSRLKVWYLELCSLRNRFLRMIKVEHSNSGKDPDPFPDPDPDPDLDPDSEPDMFKSSSALSVPISASSFLWPRDCFLFFTLHSRFIVLPVATASASFSALSSSLRASSSQPRFRALGSFSWNLKSMVLGFGLVSERQLSSSRLTTYTRPCSAISSRSSRLRLSIWIARFLLLDRLRVDTDV
mmetsp:Transcript_26610/g.42178  ORF Transcript_26610/g.42178 Transcript_26610/m.42178 type:complete len:280 (-) Transcript_26610:62-901(-)